jgi:hemerythrin
LLGEAVVIPLTNTAEDRAGLVQLQALIAFAQEHFAFEEGLMRSAGYPEAEQHAKYHASLLAELRTFCYKVERGLKADSEGLISFLWSWLVQHIGTADRELAVWLRSRDSDGRLNPPVS